MISKSTICFNSFYNLGFKVRSIFLTGVTTGVTLTFISILWVFLIVPISPKQTENSYKICSSLAFTTEIHFFRFRSKWSFLCFRVSEHFPCTWILEFLYVDNFMFTGQRSGSGPDFFKIVKGLTLHWALVSILHETGIQFKGRIIDQLEFSFLEFWIQIVSIKNS